METKDELKAPEKEYYDLPDFYAWEKQKNEQAENLKRLLETNDCV